MSTTECKHKFRPRYSRRVPEYATLLAKRAAEKGGKFQVANLETEEVYECDVCIRCGKVVKP